MANSAETLDEFLLAMSSLFPEFKVHADTLIWKLTFKTFQTEHRITNISWFFCFLLGLYPRHQADHLSGSVVLLSLLCVTPVFLFFSSVVVFFPSEFPAVSCRVHKTTRPLSPESPERRVVTSELPYRVKPQSIILAHSS